MPEIVDRATWTARRIDLLAAEKALTRQHDELAARRRELPWVLVDEPYEFDTEHGRRSLADLFDGRSQLVVYHFMYGTDWSEGCPSCSFWADNYDGLGVHLAARDVTLIAASTAPLAELLAYQQRLPAARPRAQGA